MPPDPLIGKTLGDYTIIELLGRGGMARVYRGHDAKLDRDAAVKVVFLADTPAEDVAEYQKRFEREGRAIARLQHPNIVGVYQFGQSDDLYFMAMQFIEGEDLGQILEKYSAQGIRPPVGQVLRIARDIASALDYAHAHGVIHRDVKPSNIMVTPEGNAILTDFGLVLQTQEGTMGTTFGSAHYMAPEQAVSSANAVPQTDQYALGVVLYEMLCGKRPFDDPSAMSVAIMHMQDPPPPLRQFNPELGAEVEQVILRAMAKVPIARFPTVTGMVRALEAALSSDQSAGQPGNAAAPERAGLTRLQPPEPVPTGRAAPQHDLKAAPDLEEQGQTIVLPHEGHFPGLPPTGTALPARQRHARRTVAVLVLAALVALALLVLAAGGGTAPASSAPPDILLLYDGDAFLLVNQADHTLDIAGLVFRREGTDFSASQWSGGTAPPSALPARQCFHLWRNNLNVTANTMSFNRDACDVRAAWRATSQPHWFWISDSPDATFDVILSGTVLRTCEIVAGRCEVTLP